MSQEYIEVSAKTLDEAITAACQKLSVTSERLDYEVVDQGSAGFLGFNARNAVIKARAKQTEEKASEKAVRLQGDMLEQVHADAAKEEAEQTAKEEKAEGNERSDCKTDRGSYNNKRGGRRDYGRSSQRDFKPRRSGYGDFTKGADLVEEPVREERKHSDEPKVHYTDEQVALFHERAKTFLTSMFEAMKMEVEVTTTFDPEENILTIDFAGEDMGVLIGKRGQTLDSIQYLASLVVNKDVPGYVHVKADTENYRERRKKTLENLAKNIAFKVKRSHRAVALEPMNPYERRIIHSALQGDRYVTTYSEGEDPYRKVVVAPKR